MALALGDILRKEEAKDGANAKKAKEDAREAYAHFAPGGGARARSRDWRDPPASGEARRGGAAGGASTANLLRHLAKTVAAKSPDLLRVGEELRSPRGEEPERNDATRGETFFARTNATATTKSFVARLGVRAAGGSGRRGGRRRARG